uniref:TF-B3 domain-containing protein n=1 Tax=Nelumbo nucifera TaxID=4432 RepID=A0A822ZLC7_NELNU|nr:TPA_asm: hypothetical protein HUJ06_016811 [Nelumbo nucifera]
MNLQVIPAKFVKNLKEDLSSPVTLRGPTGKVWKVGLVKAGDSLFFQYGWDEFVEDHNLEEEDLLVFRYSGSSTFDVLMFDQLNLCEKECSYFVGKCGCERKENTRDDSMEADFMHSSVERGRRGGRRRRFTSSTKTNQGRRGRGRGRGRRTFISPTNEEELKTSEPGIRRNSSQSNDRSVRKEASASVRDCAKRKFMGEESADSFGDDGIPENLSRSYQLHFVSKRRPVTEVEKKRAYQLASAASASTDHRSFIVVMRQTHVCRRFHLTIPVLDVTYNFPPRNQDVTLSLKGKTWPVIFKYQTNPLNGGFASGWADFVFDNNLEEDDVCVFEVVGGRNNSILVNVQIFRVVEAVTPLRKVKCPSRRSAKRQVKEALDKVVVPCDFLD